MAYCASLFKDHFSGHAAAYAAARPRYPRSLFAWLAAEAPARSTVWDCATGNGQAAVSLAEYFDVVHATDASREQIDHALLREKIRYGVAAAEASGLPGNSLDAITVAQAAHWFDLPAFYAEARRTLKDQGLLAMWGYGLTRIETSIDRIIDWFYIEVVGTYWPPERRHIDRAYEDLGFPFARVATPRFRMLERWTLQELLAYISSWSAVQRCRQQTQRDPVPELQRKLAGAWGDPGLPRNVRWPLFMLAGRADL
ncbi:class I SAM-dependent methyltransferase [soil metagenome]